MAKKHFIQAAIEASDDETITAREYSGRGMYGRKCLGVTIGRDSHVGELVALLLDMVPALDDDEEITEVADAFWDMRSDSMGLGTIVYFPRIAYVGGDTESET